MTALLAALAELVQNLPAIVKLIQNLQANIAEMNTERKIADDLATISKAFETKDATLLNNIFNGIK